MSSIFPEIEMCAPVARIELQGDAHTLQVFNAYVAKVVFFRSVRAYVGREVVEVSDELEKPMVIEVLAQEMGIKCKRL